MIGTVLFWKKHGDSQFGGFGFIVPDDTPNNRETNLWFGPRALNNGVTVRSGDRVDFDEGNYRPGKGRSASHVRLIEDDDDDKIETIHGEFET